LLGLHLSRSAPHNQGAASTIKNNDNALRFLDDKEDRVENVTNPVAEKVLTMITGYRVSQIVGTLAELGIPDRLANGPLSFDELAKEIGCNPDATYRVLRASASINVVSITTDGRFGLTPLGEILRSKVPGSMRESAIALTAPGHWLPWGRLVEAVRQGIRQTPAALGRELFEFYAENPGEGSAFTGAMSNVSAAVAEEVARVLDTSTAEHVVDVGGASGTIIAALLARNAALHGTILELAHVVPQARAVLAELGLSSRCKVLEGDFFKSVPQADIHILKYIIHDWDDEQSVRILSNCARALRRNGRVILVERVLPEDGSPSFAPLADLNMLVLLPGRERTAKQYSKLFEAAGLCLDRVIETTSAMQVIEASAVSL
jgi:SAM-dependent methyltransferase